MVRPSPTPPATASAAALRVLTVVRTTITITTTTTTNATIATIPVIDYSGRARVDEGATGIHVHPTDVAAPGVEGVNMAVNGDSDYGVVLLPCLSPPSRLLLLLLVPLPGLSARARA